MNVEMICIAERFVKIETVAQRVFGNVFAGFKLCFNPV